MQTKDLLRKKYSLIRKKKYYEIDKKFFFPLLNFIKKKFGNKSINISAYFPSAYELNTLKMLELNYFSKSRILLPKINKNFEMKFFKWNKNDVLKLNNFGIPEPLESKEIIPNVILVPLLVFDQKKNRIGYGKGFYDRYLKKNLKKGKKILTIGIAFSFQKHHNVPANHMDINLDYILTEKGMF